ncbi:hypothetical protein TrRE_jg10211 [Triparma retinervis]|uniref:Uncharacterized protein n=1 Tax=Triparma retinervis TaxID=2557542 RepID=A0A9W7E052_9STRA|nr:hypothetical protein TrRE_jg10211 [Triparma retinervis]
MKCKYRGGDGEDRKAVWKKQEELDERVEESLVRVLKWYTGRVEEEGLGEKEAWRKVARTVGVLVRAVGEEGRWRDGVKDALGCTKDLGEEEGEGKVEIIYDTKSGGIEDMVVKAAVTTGCFMAGGGRGVWCLGEGWCDGNGMKEIAIMIGGEEGMGMWAAAEVMVNAVNWDEGRVLFKDVIEGGGMQRMAGCKETRTQGVVAFAKLGMASKGMGGEEGEEVGDLAKGMLEDEVGGEGIGKGVEVLGYLTVKTKFKEEVAYDGTTIKRLVEVASGKELDNATAYGVAGIFASIAVSVEQIRKEAFKEKEFSEEQYDQMMKMQSTQKGEDAPEKEMDPLDCVKGRVRVMVDAGVVRALSNIAGMQTSSSGTRTMCMLGLSRLAVEEGSRGSIIQQGGLKACQNAAIGGDIGDEGRGYARHAIAKILVTTNPGLLTETQRKASIKPLIEVCGEHGSSSLMQFEALLSLTNLGTSGEDVKGRIAKEGLRDIGYLTYEDHDMVRRAAVECIGNLVPAEETLKYFRSKDKVRLWVAYMRDYQESYELARAAGGGLAMACYDWEVKETLVGVDGFAEGIVECLKSGAVEIMHRALVVVKNMVGGNEGAGEEEGKEGLKGVGGRVKKLFEDKGVVEFCVLYAHNADKLKGSLGGEGGEVLEGLAKDVCKMLEEG